MRSPRKDHTFYHKSKTVPSIQLMPASLHASAPIRGIIYIADHVSQLGHGDGSSHSCLNRKCDPGHEREEGPADPSPTSRFLPSGPNVGRSGEADLLHELNRFADELPH